MRASAPPSTTASASAPRRWWSRPACSTAGCRSTGLTDFEGAGIYYAATEMEARYCKGTEAVIIGGGNSAGQAAMFLSRSARCVRVLGPRGVACRFDVELPL